MPNLFRFTRPLLSPRRHAPLLGALLLAGCGGSGGDGEPAPPPGTQPGAAGITIEGYAAKGLLGLATITVEELGSNGEVVADVRFEENGTNTEGFYTIELSDDYGGGPVLVSAIINPDSAMKCDATAGCGRRVDGLNDPNGNILVNFGEWFKPPPFKMSALIPAAEPGQRIRASITPFTHMAAGLARASGAVDGAAVARANSEISNLLGGIDVINTRAIDITDAEARAKASPTQIVYAALGAAIANFALREGENTDGERIEKGLEKLVASIEGGVMAADDSAATFGDDSAVYSLREIVDEARAILKAVGLVDSSGVLERIEGFIAAAGDSDNDKITEYDPAPSAGAGDEALAKVKGLMEDLRTWGYRIESELYPQGSSFEEQIQLAWRSAAFVSEDLTDEILIAAIDVAGRFDGTTDLTAYPLTNHWAWSNFAAGTIERDASGRIVIRDALFRRDVEVVIDGVATTEPRDFATLDMVLILPEVGATASEHTYRIESATLTGPYSDATIGPSTVTLHYDAPYTLTRGVMALGTAALDADRYSLELDLSLTQKWDLEGSRQASIEDPYRRWIDVEFDKPVTFSGTLVGSFHPVVEAGAIVWATPATLQLTGRASDGDNEAAVTIAANVTNAATFRPVSATRRESADNWMSGNFGVTLATTLEDQPELRLTIEGVRTGYQAGEIETTLAFDDQRLTIATSGDALAGTIGHAVTITNQDGAVLEYDPATTGVGGTLSYQGKVYGTLSRTPGGYLKVEYIDETFEIF